MIKNFLGSRYLPFGVIISVLLLTVVLGLTVARVQNPKTTLPQPKATWNGTDCNSLCTYDKAGCVAWCGFRKTQGDQDLKGVDCNQACSNLSVCKPLCYKLAPRYDCPALCNNPGNYNDCVTWCTADQGKYNALKGVNCSATCKNSTACNQTCQAVYSEIAGSGRGTGGGGGGSGGSGNVCNASSPADVWSCYQKTGNCSGSWACHNGGSCPPSCTTGGGGTGGSCFDNCFNNIRPGNGTYCRGCCAAGSETCTPANPETHLECVNNACVKVNGTGSNLSGCTVAGQSCGTGACQTSTDCPSGQVCAPSCFLPACLSANPPCKIPTPSCAASTCVPADQLHLACNPGNNTCGRLAGSGTNEDSCTTVGTACAPDGEVGVCWGNSGANGRCFDCNGDGVINILDFSCFAKRWLQNI